MAETIKPTFNLSSGETLEASWGNTHINVFNAPDDALNHIIIRKEQAGMCLAHTIFRHVIPNFDELVEAMITDGYPFTYRPEPTESTETYFRDKFVGNIDTFPASWVDDDGLVVIE